jgi:3-methyladenine DNA glycosylase AlkC
MTSHGPTLPTLPTAIPTGTPLKELLGPPTLGHLARNIRLAWAEFDEDAFLRAACAGLEPLGLMERGRHIATALRQHLPPRFADALGVLERSLTAPLGSTTGMGLAFLFHFPHSAFVAEFGLDPAHNGGEDPFEAAMAFQHQLTRRATAEFCIRPFLEAWPQRTLARLLEWTADPDPHVRRLCSEGLRPRLPWAKHLPPAARPREAVHALLERLRDDPSDYVRRSVANHLGDLAKEDPDGTFALCGRWLEGAGAERRALVRHALRHPARNGVPEAVRLRQVAGGRVRTP